MVCVCGRMCWRESVCAAKLVRGRGRWESGSAGACVCVWVGRWHMKYPRKRGCVGEGPATGSTHPTPLCAHERVCECVRVWVWCVGGAGWAQYSLKGGCAPELLGWCTAGPASVRGQSSPRESFMSRRGRRQRTVGARGSRCGAAKQRRSMLGCGHVRREPLPSPLPLCCCLGLCEHDPC